MAHPTSEVLELRGSLPAMALSGSARGPRLLARIMAILSLVFLIAIWILPWQQSVKGEGRVIAFDPLERKVSVEAAVSGMVRKLHVVEGQHVKKGDVLAEIQDNDPNLLANLRLQHDAAIARRAAASQRIEDLSQQILQQTQAKEQALDVARQRVAAEKITAETAKLNFDRTRELKGPGLVSERDFELAKLLLESSQANFTGAESSLKRTESEFDATISGIRANKGTAESELAAAQREIATIDIQINQNQRQVVEATRDGIVLAVLVTDGSYLRPGSPICQIIPETESRFVEMWLDGNDMPLVSPRHRNPDGTVTPGSHVRLQFEGWPAIQFVGWPSVAVGTFGGEVVFVDATDDGKGRFRIVVAPQPDILMRGGKAHEETWPGNRYLRQGVRAKGWVLLRQVPVWKEIWRQLNGFPPVVAEEDPSKAGNAKK